MAGLRSCSEACKPNMIDDCLAFQTLQEEIILLKRAQRNQDPPLQPLGCHTTLEEVGTSEACSASSRAAEKDANSAIRSIEQNCNAGEGWSRPKSLVSDVVEKSTQTKEEMFEDGQCQGCWQSAKKVELHEQSERTLADQHTVGKEEEEEERVGGGEVEVDEEEDMRFPKTDSGSSFLASRPQFEGQGVEMEGVQGKAKEETTHVETEAGSEAVEDLNRLMHKRCVEARELREMHAAELAELKLKHEEELHSQEQAHTLQLYHMHRQDEDISQLKEEVRAVIISQIARFERNT